MKQWQLGHEPGWKHFQLVEAPDPIAGPGEVLIRVQAVSLNYRDQLVATMASRFTPGRVPCSDGAGEIVAVGAGVERWKVGDRVAATFFRDWVAGRFKRNYHSAALGGSVDGMLRELIVVPQHSLVALPDDWSAAEGSTLPCAGLTAWYSLVTRGGIQPGDTVLLMGTGGVSIWGLQIAVASGARAIVTSSSDAKLARARDMGAFGTINYQRSPEWSGEVIELTQRRGVDHILEVGGPGTLAQSLACIAAGGHIAQIGVLTGFDAPQTSLFPLVSQNATMSGIYVGDRESFQQFVRFLNHTKVRPVIDQQFDFTKVPEAFDYMASGSHFGKVVIDVL